MVVLRTVSKLGLAGIALAISPATEWIQQFNKLRSPYNVNVLTQAAALFLLERVEVLEEQAARIRKERTSLAARSPRCRVSRYFLPRRTSSWCGCLTPDRAYAGLLRQECW